MILRFPQLSRHGLPALFVAAALALGSRTARAYPMEDRVLSSEAQKAYNAGDFAKAQELYNRAAQKNKANVSARFNLGAAAYKAGSPEAAEQALRSVYEETDKGLNAAADYNLGVMSHQKARPVVEKALAAMDAAAGGGAPSPGAPPATNAKPPTAAAAPADLEAEKKQIEEAEKALTDSMARYRSAILRSPADEDMKVNYEVAKHDLDILRRRQQQLAPPPSQQNQDSKDKKNQDQPDQKNDQSKGDGDDDQNKPQPKPEGKPDDQKQQGQGQPTPTPTPQGGDDKKDKGENGEQPKDQPKDGQKPNDEKPKDGDKDKGEPQDTDGEQPPKATPTPTPKSSPTPGPNGQPEQSQKNDRNPGKPDPNQQANAGGKGEQKESQPTPGEMGPRDVERLLNSLPPENQRALQNALNIRPAPGRDMEKDW